MNPSITVTAGGLGGLGGSEVHGEAQASAGLAYSFVVVGPPTTSPVAVKFSGEVSTPFTANTGDGNGSSNGLVILCCDNSGNALTTVIQGPFTTILSLTAGTVYTVLMQAQASVDAGLTPITLPAFVDPTLTPEIDGYSIEYSPGLLSTSATPLPAAAPLFASGLGVLGLLGWRRKKKKAAALAA
ncbi:MAG TPA: hypothetical protein VEJ43_00845 [Pseudolabrys sp.]|nr:hypothetical protein [Pseudolabrys sp.]